MEVAALVLLLAMFAMVGLSWSGLPDMIPTHYGASGLPDHYGSKDSIWLVPAIGTSLYLLMTVITRLAASGKLRLNVPPGMDPQSSRLQTDARQFLTTLKMLVMATFAYITWNQTNRPQQGLGQAFLPIMLVVPLCLIGAYLLRLRRHSR
jgi:uncharacterized membrane protein